MIKFFRKIRQQLLNENRFSKYLIYAIGEITLVVIGIIIALAINNWNNTRNERVLELKMLKEIKANLNLDLEEIRTDIWVMDDVHAACNQLKKILDTSSVPSEDFFSKIVRLRMNPHFNANTSGYELLSSKGVDIIQNDSLRGAISSIYKLSYPYYKQYEQEKILFTLNHITPLLLEHFTWLSDSTSIYESSYEISNKEYLEIRDEGQILKLVHATFVENDIVKNRAKRIEKHILDLLDFLNHEIKSH